MKILFTLFLTAMVAITIERCRAEYLLVEVDDDDSRTPKNDDVGKDDDPVKEPKNDDVGKNGDVVRVPNNDDEIRKQEIEQLKRDNICDIKPCCCDSCYPCDYEVIAKLRKIAEERKAPENRQNSTLSGSKSCPIACPNCCDDDACGAEEQKYCYECCPAPNKKQETPAALDSWCKGRPTVGDCDMLISGFTFDPVSKTCKSFKDRGCAETKNLYRTLEECETTCNSKPKQEGDKCASDSECGEGLECKSQFPFGINFKFPNLTCVKKEGCARPKQDGKCRLTGQNVTYFDDRSGECRTHIFNGCKDNGHVSVSADPSECTNLRKGCTPCQVHRDSVMEEISEQNLVGSFVPSCEKSGHFKTKQFSASSGYSFCFDKNGNNVESAREWIRKLDCSIYVDEDGNQIDATPRECCKKAGVPEFCLGLCSPADAMARQGKRINACSKYDSIIEGCFQAAEPSVQETSDESDEDGPTISHGSPTIVRPQGKQESPRGIEIQKQGRTLEKKSDVCKNHGEPCCYTRGDQFPENVGACCGGLRCDQNPKSSDGLPLLGGAGKCVKKSRAHPVC